MCSRNQDFSAHDILPVAVFDRDCWWRDLALSSLERAGCRYRVVFTSESTVGVRAAVRAGIATALLNETDDADGLSRLPSLTGSRRSCLVLQKSAAATAPVHDAMCESIRKSFMT